MDSFFSVSKFNAHYANVKITSCIRCKQKIKINIIRRKKITINWMKNDGELESDTTRKEEI